MQSSVFQESFFAFSGARLFATPLVLGVFAADVIVGVDIFISLSSWMLQLGTRGYCCAGFY